MSKKANNIQPREHYYLVHGTIIHTIGEQIGSADINGLVVNQKKEIPAYQLGRAQQVLQMNFFKRMGDTKTKVRDVVISNIIHLGFFTNEEFQATPDGMTMQELQAAIADEPEAEGTKVFEDPAEAMLN